MAPRVSIVLPCLDEAEGVEECVRTGLQALAGAGLTGEVVVVDNGSSDGSAQIAAASGARVVHQPARGYGAAILAGFAAAHGDYLVMADADGSYDLADVPRFITELDAGADLVMGDRMSGIQPGAMPWVNRRVGNPALSALLNVLFRTQVHDAHCGMRALRRSALARLDLHASGMEFASEMVIRAGMAGLAIRELPIRYHRRHGTSKLSPLRDGLRHVRLLLLSAPLHLFVLPGAVLAVLGLLVMGAVLAEVQVLGRQWHLHTLVAGSLLLLAGVQTVALGVCAQTYAAYHLGIHSRWFTRLRARLRLGHGLLAGATLLVVGLVIGGIVVAAWADRGFADLAEEQVAIVAAALVVIGVQVAFTSLLLSVLGMRQPRAVPVHEAAQAVRSSKAGRKSVGVTPVASGGGCGGLSPGTSSQQQPRMGALA